MKVELVVSVILRQTNLALHKKNRTEHTPLPRRCRCDGKHSWGTWVHYNKLVACGSENTAPEMDNGPGDMHRPGRMSCAEQKLASLNIGSLLAFRALRDFELNFLTFFQGLKTVHVDCGEVSEQIFTAVIWSDEAKAFGIIEPLNSTSCHKKNFLN
jgi:hypothetical protein